MKLFIAATLLLLAHCALAADPATEPAVLAPSSARGSDLNAAVLKAVYAMPTGGSYQATRSAIAALDRAVQLDSNGLALNPKVAMPSFCSEATYLVFLNALNQQIRDGKLALTPDQLSALLPKSQADGAGVWGRWNANGPGTARLFYELRLGRNFTSIDQARPGDFMKIFWNDNIGAQEHGHSVVYLGRTTGPAGEDIVRFWSSNKPNGYGFKEVPRSKMKRLLFSRLEDPAGLRRAPDLAKDPYLASMLLRGSSEQEMFTKVGIAPQ